MKVTLAESAGFCFGVQRAVDVVNKQIEEGDGFLYTYGPIIHNEEVVKEFEDGRKITRKLEFKLTEDTLPLALEMGIIESKEADELIDFSEEKHFCGDCLIDEMLRIELHLASYGV